MSDTKTNSNIPVFKIVLMSTALTTAVFIGLALLFVDSLAKNPTVIRAFIPEITNSKPSDATVTTREVVKEESKIIDIVQQANPAVVSVVVTKDVPVIEQYYEDFFGFPFDMFGGMSFQIPQQRQNGTERREIGGGSGFFVSADGYVVTNRHVVDDSEADYSVVTNDGQVHPAKVLATDPVLDIAILKVDGEGFSYLAFGDSDTLQPGQTVIAIGNALAEFHNSVSVGVISGLARSIVAGGYGGSEQLENVIQTDAAINPGNSGGPLLDMGGRVIGVNVAVARGSENISFALPGNAIQGVVDSVRTHGEIVRPYLGIRYLMVTENLQERNDLPVAYGALVVRGQSSADLAVIPGSPADLAGIVENDIILSIDGVDLDDSVSLASIIRQKQVGQIIELEVYHRGEINTYKATLVQAPSES